MANSRIGLIWLSAAGRFSPESDADMLVTFAPDAQWMLMDIAEMRDELSRLFGRLIDLFERRAVERSSNPIRRKAILSAAEVIYAV